MKAEYYICDTCEKETKNPVKNYWIFLKGLNRVLAAGEYYNLYRAVTSSEMEFHFCSIVCFGVRFGNCHLTNDLLKLHNEPSIIPPNVPTKPSRPNDDNTF